MGVRHDLLMSLDKVCSYFRWNLSVFQELYVALHVLKNAEMHINIDLTQKAMKQIKKRKTKQ